MFPLLFQTILLRMDDKMNRELSCEVSEGDTSFGLADELVHYGFINEVSAHISHSKMVELNHDTVKHATQALVHVLHKVCPGD